MRFPCAIYIEKTACIFNQLRKNGAAAYRINKKDVYKSGMEERKGKSK